jgi:hypothetical protein
MASDKKWVVLGTNSDQKVQIFGFFLYEDTAEAWAKKMGNKFPRLNFLPMPITPRGELEDYVKQSAVMKAGVIDES